MYLYSSFTQYNVIEFNIFESSKTVQMQDKK